MSLSSMLNNMSYLTALGCVCRWDVSKLEPLVAAPHSPDNRKTARECSDVKIDRVYIGSCTGGGLDLGFGCFFAPAACVI
jgi:hypothetical protein